MRRGTLIVFEGAEGVGKSTQVARLAAHLEQLGVAHVVLREPGGTPLGERIRALVLEPGHEVAARAEALLFMAARAQLMERVRADLHGGAIVLLDRFFLSTYAYQVAGRGLPEAEVRAANDFATGGLVPDLTLLLGVPVGEGLARVDRRGGRDRMERAGLEFHERVAAAFTTFADPLWQRTHREAGPVVTVDASGDEAEVGGRVLAAVSDRWPETFRPVSRSQY